MTIRYLLLTGLAVLAFSSCRKDLLPGECAGEPIQFDGIVDCGPEADEESGRAGDTKTEYSGYVRYNKERIDWVEWDKVKVFLHTHGSNNTDSQVTAKDYYTVNVSPDGEKSKARFAAVTTPLQWVNDRTHDFYSLYPADGIFPKLIENNLFFLLLLISYLMP